MGHSKNMFVDEGGALKREQKQMGRGCTSMYVCSYFFLKKMLGFWKWSFIILQFFLLIIMAVWNTIMKDYNIWSYQWMGCDFFRQPFLLCTTFCFLCTVHYFLYTFSAKMATYSLVIDNVHFVISSYMY